MSDKLAANIKRRRLELGLTQQELADRLGYTSKQAITKIESGDNNIPLSKVEAFAEALETTPQELLQFDDGISDFDRVLLQQLRKLPQERKDLILRIIMSYDEGK